MRFNVPVVFDASHFHWIRCIALHYFVSLIGTSLSRAKVSLKQDSALRKVELSISQLTALVNFVV